MKKILTALIMALTLGVSGAGLAKDKCICDGANNGRGGYLGGSEAVISVKQAMTLPDETDVTLKGKILKRIKKDKYMFADDSGKIVVEIDNDVWKGQTVSPKDTVFISGELNKDDDKSIIEVERLKKK